MEPILHITTHDAWKKALQTGEYEHETLKIEGFIHCSKPSQILWVANQFYRGRRDLILLEILVDKVKNEMKWENSESGKDAFPHIYGTLNTDAVIRTHPFPPNADGNFDKNPVKA